MNRSTILDDRYRVIGYIDAGEDGRQKALNSRYEVVGYYDPVRNQTRDARYRIVARGNTLSALIVCGSN